jgi:hypothetical protein
LEDFNPVVGAYSSPWQRSQAFVPVILLFYSVSGASDHTSVKSPLNKVSAFDADGSGLLGLLCFESSALTLWRARAWKDTSMVDSTVKRIVSTKLNIIIALHRVFQNTLEKQLCVILLKLKISSGL